MRGLRYRLKSEGSALSTVGKTHIVTIPVDVHCGATGARQTTASYIGDRNRHLAEQAGLRTSAPTW
jgi:hypothetical protein